MFDWIPNLLMSIFGQFFLAVFLGCVIGFGVRDLLQEVQDRHSERLRRQAKEHDEVAQRLLESCDL